MDPGKGIGFAVLAAFASLVAEFGIAIARGAVLAIECATGIMEGADPTGLNRFKRFCAFPTGIRSACIIGLTGM